jgi:uncharacterized protein YyaL (SSP411 family)
MTKSRGRRLAVLVAAVVLFVLAIGARHWLLGRRAGPFQEHRLTAEAKGEQKEVEHKYSNHLVNETSPYLRMHAHNPVNWYPWGEEAFAKAKKEDKPVFLSVGYSTCYWCQVMERESFTNSDVAEIMNEHFISIKVDREQRPDIDEQYMLATQLMTGRGGWPNSVWLTTDGRPWMAGTYFPKEQFIRILESTAEIWRTRRKDVDGQADELAQAIGRIGSGGFNAGKAVGAELDRSLVQRAVERYQGSYDRQHGGFGGAPKFPPHGALALLTSEYRRTKDPKLLAIVTGTLDAMWLGGMHDHVGGGFHRYSTDRRWLVPHFEKMLYDNAQLMRLYAEGFEITGNERYREAVEDIHTWLGRKMTGAEGGLYSAIDAEVDGEEGRSYVWLHKEVLDVLGEEDGRLFAETYNVRPEGNYAEERAGGRTGGNIPHLSKSVETVAAERGVDAGALRQKLADMRRRLLERRLEWVQAEIDDKILSAWNGLAIEGLAYAGRTLDEPRYTKTAERAAAFILEEMYDDGRLLRSYRAGKAEQLGFLDDHAYLAAGLLELYRATGNARWLAAAQRLAYTMLADFQDEANGGFFFTAAEGHEKLLTRSKHLSGGGNVPDPNGVAARVLIDLGRVTGRAEYRAAAERALRSLAGVMQQSPRAAESALVAVSEWYRPAEPLTEGPVASGGRERKEAPADAHAQAGPVTVEAYASRLRVAPGRDFRVAVALDIHEGWHLYAENPEIDFLVPTRVEMVSAGGLKPQPQRVPEPHRKTDPILERPVNTYAGQVWFLQPIRVDKDAEPGERTLTLRVRTQACDKSRCLPPKTTEVALRITVAPDAPAEDEPRHASVFGRFAGDEDQ